ncbi:hypothetical protein MNB_SV-5-864 [hydrothermal vent metagenome]|uniref:Lipoprotein n=1 Tax=hydrothermal vent metagenome TaxID=652676 RepID=A0A1W1ECF0_9ZZZZ
MINRKNTLILLILVGFMAGCTNIQQPQPKTIKINHDQNKTKNNTIVAPKPPKKDIELQEVEDTNFSSEYMYPTTEKKPTKPSEETTTEEVETKAEITDMTKTECISMIGQEKFDKYTQMYGGEDASIKKCKMLKSI